jgi:uncharacterized membrane protein YfcA
VTLLPPEVGPLLALGLTAASLGTSLIAAAFGLGGGAIMLGLLAAALPPAALIPVHGLVQLASNAGRAALMAREAARGPILAFALGAVVGAGLGGAVAVELPPGAVQVLVGLFLLWSVGFRPPAWMARTGTLAGAASSFLTMFVGATGPFVAAWVKTLGLPRTRHVATHAAMMTLQHLLKSVVFGIFGFAFGPWLGLVAAMAAAGFLGTLIGRRLLMTLDERLFGRILSAILILIALRLLWTGGAALLGAAP